MLSSVTVDNLALTKTYGRRFFPTSNYRKNKLKTGESEIAEYAFEDDVVLVQKGYWYPKRLLQCFTPHLVVLIEDSASVKSIYSISIYQKRTDHPNGCDDLNKYIDIIYEFGAPRGTAKRLIKECLENMDDLGELYDKTKGAVFIYINRTEIFEGDDDCDISVYKEDVCVVCMENKPDILFCNCGHLIVCDECYNKLHSSRRRNNRCPKCRKENDIVRKI